MRVKLATQIFSNSLYNGLIFYKKRGVPELHDADGTILFTKRFNDLFDVLNRKYPAEGILESNLVFLNNWEQELHYGAISKEEFLTESTAQGLRVSLLSTLELTKYLLEKCDFKYVLTTKMNQDPLECTWPTLDPQLADPSITYSGEEPVKVMILADTHLLGSRNGHWFDKLRREWQMHRAFQTAMTLHQPDLVFVLGDVTDEGLWCSEQEFQAYVHRFHKLFAVPEGTRMYVVVGNHDIGFHYGISPYLNQRFVSGFDSPTVRLVSLRGVHFILVNSMALEGDGCSLCRGALQQLGALSARLGCSAGLRPCNSNTQPLPGPYSRPILLQHFPLYRDTDASVCDTSQVDVAPPAIRVQRLRERWDCLSREATDRLLELLRPRVALDGHIHHGCQRYYDDYKLLEITVPSFSWRNKENPNYAMAVFTPNNYAIGRCEMPKETSVYMLYGLGMITMVFWLIFSYRRMPRRPTRMFKLH